MDKKTKMLLIAGGLCFGCALIVGSVLQDMAELKDFILGLGTAFIVSALFVQVK